MTTVTNPVVTRTSLDEGIAFDKDTPSLPERVQEVATATIPSVVRNSVQRRILAGCEFFIVVCISLLAIKTFAVDSKGSALKNSAFGVVMLAQGALIGFIWSKSFRQKR